MMQQPVDTIKKVAIVGYSGHALVAADILQQAGYIVTGYVEKEKKKQNPLKLYYLGYEQDDDFIEKVSDMSFFPAIGENIIRKRVTILLEKKGLKIVTAISPKAYVSRYSVIQSGTLICQGTCINAFAKIGKGVIINTGAIVEHECIIHDFTHIAPGAVIAGNVEIFENCFIGANSVVKQGITIGKNVIVGAGSVVLRDIPDDEIWAGNPSRKLLN